MPEATVDLETRIENLELRLTRLEELLLERATTLPEPVLASQRVIQGEQPAVTVPEALPLVESRIDIALVGRSLIGMGGAYLLRALTESRFMPDNLGLALGLAYALFWIFLADRSASRGDAHASTFSAAVGAMIGYPLLCEATARFHSFSIEFASFVLFFLSIALLSIAWRRGAGSAAWIACLGALGSSAVLALASEQVASVLVAQALIGALIWHISSERKWLVVRWPSVAATWFLSVILQVLVLAGHDGDSADFSTVVLLIVAFAYLGAVAAKNLLIRENVTSADIVQAFGTIAFVLTGAARISATLPHLMPEVTIAIGAVAAGAYFSALRQPPEDARAAYYFGGLAVACTLISTAIPLSLVRAGLIWIVLATISINVARHFSAPHFMVHSMVYATAGAAATGLLGGALQTITGLGHRPPIAILPALASAALAVAATIAMSHHEITAMQWRVARVVLLALTALMVIAGLDLVALRLTGSVASAAAVRSGVIALSAVALAFLARLELFSDCSVLVYPVLALGAAKFVIDDFISGRAATLFVTLAVYGFALLILARMRRTPQSAARVSAHA